MKCLSVAFCVVTLTEAVYLLLATCCDSLVVGTVCFILLIIITYYYYYYYYYIVCHMLDKLVFLLFQISLTLRQIIFYINSFL